jgi:hypothetical protein
VDDAQLRAALATVSEFERATRQHVRSTTGQAAEQVRGQASYRHAVALRKSLEDWIETRTFRAAQQES